ncbi:MAG: Calx-beta domain-containing protein, partial [Dolichospermum sp.]
MAIVNDGNGNGFTGFPVGKVNRNGGDGAVSVTVNLTNGTATAPSDYNNTAITVNFANGETSKTVTIPIVNDTQFEPNETVNLTLSNPTGGVTLGTQTTAVLTILNDDLPQPGIISFNSANYSVNENANSSTIQILTVDSQTNIYPIGQPKVYSQVLTNGQKYRFEISGTWSPDYRVNNWLVDARFVTRDDFVSVNDSDSVYGDFGLYSSVLGNNNDDFLGNYQANHIYSLEYEGKGQPVDFYIYDINSGDNLGKYTIKIFEVNTITL